MRPSLYSYSTRDMVLSVEHTVYRAFYSNKEPITVYLPIYLTSVIVADCITKPTYLLSTEIALWV